MIERRVVRRYATALFYAASDADAIDQVESDLGLITYVLESSPRLMDTIRSPLVPRDTKRTILTELFQKEIHQVTMNYLYLLVDKRREEAIMETQSEYILLANEARGIVDAHITAAVELKPEEQTRLTSKLAAMTGKRINLIPHVDPSIIGGLVVRIGDTIIDGSIKGKLAELKEQLLN